MPIGAFKLNSIAKASAVVPRIAKTISVFGNAQVSTAQSKFGGASSLYDGTGDYLQIANNTDFNLGTALTVWTVECWTRYATLPGANYVGIIGKAQSGTANGWGLYVTNSGNSNVLAWGSSASAFVNGNTTVSANAWHHVVAVRNGSSFKMFLDGAEVYTTASYTNKTDPTANLLIGNSLSSTGSAFSGDLFWTGYIDEIRISNTARYSAAFTSPTAAFVNDANTLLLIHANGTNASTVFTDDNS